MASPEPMITAGIFRGFDDYLRATYPKVNIGLPQLVEEVGGPMLDGPPPLERFPLDKFALLLEIASKRTRDECFALHWARAFPVGGTGLFGFIIANAPDLQTMVECVTRFAKLGTDALEITCEQEQGKVQITWMLGPELVVPHQQLTEFLLTLFIDRAKRFIDVSWRPERMEFTYPEPNQAGAYEDHFGPNLVFSASHNRLTTPVSNLKRVAANADSLLFATLRSIAEKELKLLTPSKDVNDRLGSYLVQNIALKGVELDTSAKTLGLTARQLQYELQQRKTSFENEVAKVRQRLATRYLRDTDLPMTEIALMLGYSELSAFTRAAKSWFSVPPSEKRTQLRAAKDNI